MAKPKCIVCGQRAKRTCLLENKQPICAKCCSERVQNPYTACPEECPYFQPTRDYLENKSMDRFKRFLFNEPVQYVSYFNDEEAMALYILFKALEYSLKSTEPTDQELLNALDALHNELRAARSNLIYDGTSSGLFTSDLFLKMREYLEIPEPTEEEEDLTIQKKEVKEFVLDEFERDTIERVFKVLKRLIQHRKRPDDKGYITFLKSILS